MSDSEQTMRIWEMIGNTRQQLDEMAHRFDLLETKLNLLIELFKVAK